jgi:PAS domain S-box-containing protein
MPDSRPDSDLRRTTVETEAADAELALAQAAMGIITWLWDLPAGRVRWTGDLSPLLGQPAGSFSGSFPDFLQAMHPDDRIASSERFSACLRGQLPAYLAEERVIWPDGSVHWLETSGCATYGTDGRTLRMAGVIRDITERRHAQQELEGNEARLRRLIESSPVAIGMSRGDWVLSGNPAFLRLFGFADEAQAASRRVIDLVAPPARADFTARTQRRKAGEAVEIGVRGADAARRRPAPFPGLVSVSDAMLADGPAAVVFIQDLSETVRQRNALQRERDRATQYLQIARAMLVKLDVHGRVVLANERACEVLGYAEHELLGCNWFDTFRRPDEVDAAKAVFAEVMSGARPYIEYHESQALTRSGERRCIAWRNGLRLDEQGRIDGLLSSGEDITERRRADAELHALAAQLEQRVLERTAELEASNAGAGRRARRGRGRHAAKGEFLAHMSHEIRTPMNAIIGMTHLALQTATLPPRPRGYLQKIQRAADSLLAIINDVLDFSKIESGHLDIESDEFSLADVLDRVTTLVAPTASEKGLEFLLSTAADVPPMLIGDPQRLGQVLLNLCSNAVKFTERGEIVVVTVRAESAQVDRVRLRFAVRDTGIGIAPEQRSRLFSPFEQLDPSITRRFGGTGLGLAISRQLVERMGGTIDVRSDSGRGSEFHFTLDFGVPALAPPAPAVGSANQRWLIVDDSANAREVLAGLCAGLGVRHTVAASAAAAMREIERAAAHDPFDLVLLDWKMPELDGLSAAAPIRALAGRTPRLVLVTAYGAEALAAQALAAGFEACLAKPVTAAALAELLMAGAAAPAPAATAALAGRLQGRRLLLVEDNDLNQIVAGDLLADVAGASVTIAVNGREALQHLQHEPFDAVLMDLQMPEMDGFEATLTLRRMPGLSTVPVIAMTAHALARDRDRCLAVGMNDFVTKPVEPRELFAVLARWLPATAATAAPAVDFTLGLQRCLGRDDLYQRILGRFADTRGDDGATLRRQFASGDLAGAAALAHTLISSAATIGADPLSAAARALQDALDEARMDALPALLDRLQQLHALVLLAVSDRLRSTAPTLGA